MKKFLLSLAAVVVGVSSVFADANIVVADAAGFTSGNVAEDEGWTAGDFTFKAEKNSGSTAPTYNANGKDYRVYAKGTFTVTAAQDMTKIEFTVSKAGFKRLAEITASTGTIAAQSVVDASANEGDVFVTWTGNSKSVIFTVGDKSIYGTDGDSKAGQLDFIKLDIVGGGNYTDTPVEPAEPNYEKVNAISNGEAAVFVAGGKYSVLFDKNYGYMSAEAIPAGSSESAFAGNADAAMTFTAVTGGWNITTSTGRVLGAKDGYKTFDTTDDSKDNRVWTIAFNEDGTATITNVATGKIVYQDPQYGSFGCYTMEEKADTYLLPCIFKLTTSVPEPTTVDVENINAFVVAANDFDWSRFTSPLTAVYQNGRYLYVKDNTGVLLIYGDLKNGTEAIKYANGDQIPAGVTGKYQLFNGLPQLSSPKAETFLAGVAGNPVAPVEIDLADVTNALGNTLISLTDVKIEPVMEDGAEKANNYTVSQGGDEILLYNQFANAQFYDVVTVTTGEHMNLKAIVTCYKNNVQLYPVEVTEMSGVSNVVVDENAPVEYFNLQGIRVDNPENGIYIRRQGANVSKVYVK